MQASTNTLMTKSYPKTEFIKNYFNSEINRLTEDIIEMIENQNVFSKKKYYDSKLENLYNDFYVFLLKQDLAEQVVLKDTSCKSKFNNDIFCPETYRIDTKVLPDYIQKAYNNMGYLDYEQTFELTTLSYKDLRKKIYSDISKLSKEEKMECINELDKLLQSDLSKDNLMSKDLKKVYMDVKTKLLKKVR